MKLILTHEVSGLGAAGDVIDVKDGYARNYLMPRGFATPWTKGGQKQVDAIIKARSTRAIHDLDAAKQLKGRLEAKPVTVTAKAAPVVASSAPSVVATSPPRSRPAAVPSSTSARSRCSVTSRRPAPTRPRSASTRRSPRPSTSRSSAPDACTTSSTTHDAPPGHRVGRRRVCGPSQASHRVPDQGNPWF